MKIRNLKKLVACLSVALSLISFVPVSALEHTTYGDLVSSNTTANNLVNYAYQFETFKNKDFVVYQNNQYSYYIVWGDIVYTDGILYSDNIEYINYIRSGNTGSYQYQYIFGIDDDFKLDYNHVVTSNISDVGMVSNTYKVYQYNDYFIKLLVFSISLLFAILLSIFRR